jgi:excisionase family DNA binding protein
MQNEPEDFIKIEEAMQITKLKKNTIYKFTSLKKIPHHKQGGRFLLFKKSELETWLQSKNKIESYT